MRRFFFGLAMFSIATFLPSWASAGDREIAQQVAQALRQSGQMVDYNVNVKCEDGVATLTGRVASESQAETASSIAQSLPGVTDVVNQVSVLPTRQATKSAGKTRSLKGYSLSRQSESGEAAEQAAPVTLTAATKKMSRGRNLPTATSSGSAKKTMRTAMNSSNRGNVARRANPASGSMPLGQPLAQGAPAKKGIAAQPGTFAPQSARQLPVRYQEAMEEGEGVPGAPLPVYVPGSAGGVAPARYDHPYMPNYAWPSYAAYPNYAGVNYPRQYSPTAWPYIGPFYPYPQVPLGWRKVTLEWDDGWWMLDFHQ